MTSKIMDLMEMAGKNWKLIAKNERIEDKRKCIGVTLRMSKRFLN